MLKNNMFFRTLKPSQDRAASISKSEHREDEKCEPNNEESVMMTGQAFRRTTRRMKTKEQNLDSERGISNEILSSSSSTPASIGGSHKKTIWLTMTGIIIIFSTSQVSFLASKLDKNMRRFPFRFVSFDRGNRNRCAVSIGVFTTAQNHVHRDVIRKTWARFASNLTEVELHFIIGISQKQLAPHEELQLQREQGFQNDTIHIQVPDLPTHSLAKVIAWFAWALVNTRCKYFFKTSDQTYVRVPALLQFASERLETLRNPSTKQIYGVLADQFKDPASPVTQYGMFPDSYGVSRDLALWISENKHLSPSTQGEERAMATMLAVLRNTSGLVQISDSDAFGVTPCSSRTILDGPAHSRSFNMYQRFHDDLRGDFCDHVDRDGAVDPRAVNPAAAVQYEPLILSDSSLLDDSRAPWNRGNRPSYADLEDYSHSNSAFSSTRAFPWLALNVTDNVVLGGPAVRKITDPVERARHKFVVAKAAKLLHRIIPACKRERLVGAWWKNWGASDEYVVHTACVEGASESVVTHLPCDPAGGVALHASSLVVDSERWLQVLLPLSCRLDVFVKFLRTSGKNLAKVPGPKRLVVAWTYCARRQGNFTQKELEHVVARYRERTGQTVDTLLVHVDLPFSRSRALNAAIDQCADGDVAAVIDVDMVVTVDFFLNCKAFARDGHTMYFPITFSRYNPRRIADHAAVMNFSRGMVDKLERPDTIDRDTGLWRDFGFGMASFVVSDARAVGLYDASNTAWGNEDIDFYKRSIAAGYMGWRLYDPGAVHVFHPKQCRDLAGTDRFTMCLASKARLEGTGAQTAMALLKLEGRLET